jgi:RNA polymerase sigma-70 factor (ECF subfamily)
MGQTADAVRAGGRVLERARGGDGEAFGELAEPFRAELQLHCYRILGSVQDAEDMVQETLLAAWRGLDGFEGRASVRAWLYRIATNRCLNLLRDAGRRPRPALPARPPLGVPEPTRYAEPSWYEPYPDALLDGLPDAAPGPEARYEARESLALAFVAGLQRLPPRQRAVLVLRDVLGFRAAEVAGMLGASGAAVNSALQRARATLEERVPPRDRDGMPLPRSARERALAGRFAQVLESSDVEGLVALLTGDAWLTMPPEPLAYQGPAAIAGFYRSLPWWGGRALRLLPARANGGPAFGAYLRGPQGGAAQAYGLVVLTLAGDGAGAGQGEGAGRVAAITRFGDNALLPRFGLPLELPG